MAFRQCLFSIHLKSEVTKIVLRKDLQKFKLYLLAQGIEPERFFFLFFRVTYNTGREYRKPTIKGIHFKTMDQA